MFKDLEGNYPKQLHLLRLMLFYQGSRRAALKVTVRFSIRVAMFRRLTLRFHLQKQLLVERFQRAVNEPLFRDIEQKRYT